MWEKKEARGAKTREIRKMRGCRRSWTRGGAKSIWVSSRSFSILTSTSQQLLLVFHLRTVFCSFQLTWPYPHPFSTFPLFFFLVSSGFDLLYRLYSSESLLSRLSHLLAIFVFFLSLSVSRHRKNTACATFGSKNENTIVSDSFFQLQCLNFTLYSMLLCLHQWHTVCKLLILCFHVLLLIFALLAYSTHSH